MVENALQLCEGDNVQGNVVNELCSDEGLANVCFCSHVTNLWFKKKLIFMLTINFGLAGIHGDAAAGYFATT